MPHVLLIQGLNCLLFNLFHALLVLTDLLEFSHQTWRYTRILAQPGNFSDAFCAHLGNYSLRIAHYFFVEMG